MILLQGNNLARYFGTTVLFDNVSLTIQDNARIALVGRNGVGKSTILKILAGIEQTDAGSLSRAKNIRVGYMDQHSAIESTNTIWDEMVAVFSDLIQLQKEAERAAHALADEQLLADETAYQRALDRYEQLQHTLQEKNAYGYESEIRTVLHGFRFSDIDYQRPIATLSGGQKTRLALAKILLEKHDLLILDEPTNHLDIQTLSWLETYLQHYKGALLIVSHDRYFLDKIATEIYEVTHHKMHYYKGNYSYYLTEKEARLEREWKQYEQQQNEIGKLEDFIARNIVRASTTKRAQSRRKQLEKMVRIEKPKGDEKSARFQFTTAQDSGQVVLQLEDGAIGYDHTILAEPINLDIRKQEAIALIGPNGIGKSTLLKTILAQLPLLKGQLKLGANVSVGYYDQELANLTYTNSVLDELWHAFPLTPEKDIRSILGSFLFSGDDVNKIVATLSGGERARLALAKLAMQHDNFLVLDEPTNHLDLDSKEVLENALIHFDGTLLFISHDRFFINRIATSIVELDSNGSTLYLGDYDYYLEKKAEEQEKLLEQITETTQNTAVNNHYQQSKEEQRRRRQLERQAEQLEQQLHELEQQIADLELHSASPEVFTDHEKALAISQEIADLRQVYDTTLSEWETISLTLEA